MLGTYYLMRDLIVSTGSDAGCVSLELGPRLNFLAAAAFGVAGTIIYFAISPGPRYCAASDAVLRSQTTDRSKI